MSDNKMNISQTSEYINNYIKNNYDRIVIKVKKGKKKELETHIADFGYKSTTDFIKSTINEKIVRDLENF